MSTTVNPTPIRTNPSRSRGRTQNWLKRGLLGFTSVVVILSGSGAIYQAVAAREDQRAYPPPGQMIDIGERRIHMIVQGSAESMPTVLLEAGIATFSSNWAWVQNELAASTRVVSYDRAGLGWSDPSPEPQDAQQSARDLHAALQLAGIQGPYVVAGHSYGGLVMRAFTDLYPEEVVGMVLVDASHPDQWAHIPASQNGKLTGNGNLLTAFLARVGIVRLFDLSKSVYAGLPARPAAEMRAILALPHSWKTSGDVILIWNERSRPQINQARSLGDLPLGVISVTEQAIYADILTDLQKDLVTLSSNSFHHIEQGATHESLVAEQGHARAVTNAIIRVIESAQMGNRLSAGLQ